MNLTNLTAMKELNFHVTKEQYKKFMDWKKSLPEPKTKTAMGGRFSFTFTPTSIGTYSTVKDDETGEELTLDDGSNF